MSLSDEQFNFLKDVAKLITYAVDMGFKLTGGELARTMEQQDIYVKTGRSTTYNSKHLKRLAIDLNFFVKDERDSWKLIYDKEHLQVLGDYWTSLSPKNIWGGNWKSFKDTPHFQRNN